MQLKNDLLLQTARGGETPRPPVWLMRQAGRILPQYRALRKQFKSFPEFVRTPDACAEATIQPIDELGVDAAIIFSDILVIPEALGLHYQMIEKKGPFFPKTITQKEDIQNLHPIAEAVGELEYVFEALRLTKKGLDDRVPLIGFAGAPWTIFAYMVEGSGSKTFAKARRFLYEHPSASKTLLRKISDSTIFYLKEKIRRGCDVVQLFDSWAEMLPVDQYVNFCLPEVVRILEAVEGVPRIFFPKGAWSVMPHLTSVPCEAISVDWKTPIPYFREIFGEDMILQGNLDPANLYAPEEEIAANVKQLIHEAGKRHIFNLGHGVYPDTDKNRVKFMVQQIKNSSFS